LGAVDAGSYTAVEAKLPWRIAAVGTVANPTDSVEECRPSYAAEDLGAVSHNRRARRSAVPVLDE
jgi:hypothetical protein